MDISDTNLLEMGNTFTQMEGKHIHTFKKYERIYRQAFYDAAKKADPNWKIGKPIKAGALDGVTRESAEKGKSHAQAILDTKI